MSQKYKNVRTGQDLLNHLRNMTAAELEKDVLIYDNRVGDYIDNIFDCGLEPTNSECIVIGYGKPPAKPTISDELREEIVSILCDDRS